MINIMIYNLQDPQYQIETYKCFYCGSIIVCGEKCINEEKEKEN